MFFIVGLMILNVMLFIENLFKMVVVVNILLLNFLLIL